MSARVREGAAELIAAGLVEEVAGTIVRAGDYLVIVPDTPGAGGNALCRCVAAQHGQACRHALAALELVNARRKLNG